MLEALGRTLDEGRERAGGLPMLERMRRFEGELGTRFAWLHPGVSQEMDHRAQLAVCQRLVGIEPRLTRRIRGGKG